MIIYRYTALIFLIFIMAACGIKSDPVAKSSLDIPYPTAIDYAINSEGVSIYNGSDNYTLFVERADENIGFFNLAGFKRVALINPKQVFIDTDVVNNRQVIYIVKPKGFFKFQRNKRQRIGIVALPGVQHARNAVNIA